MTVTVTLDPTMLFQNGKTPALVSVGGGNDYYNVGNGAYWQWTTSARYIEVDSYATAPFGVGGATPRPCVRIIQGGTIEDRTAWAALRDDRFYGAMGGMARVYYRAVSAYARDHGIAGAEFDRFCTFLTALDDEYLAFEGERAKAEAEKRKGKGDG